METSTSYLGFRLPHPFIAGASPLVFDLDTIERLEDDGGSAVQLASAILRRGPANCIRTLLSWSS
jgi:hypothetical protein